MISHLSRSCFDVRSLAVRCSLGLALAGCGDPLSIELGPFDAGRTPDGAPGGFGSGGVARDGGAVGPDSAPADPIRADPELTTFVVDRNIDAFSADADSFYWLTYGYRVWRQARVGGQRWNLGTVGRENGGSLVGCGHGNMQLGGDRIYVQCAWWIDSIPKVGREEKTTVYSIGMDDGSVSHLFDFIVDQDGIFVAALGFRTGVWISRLPLGGGKVTTLARIPIVESSISEVTLSADADSLFLTTPQGLFRVPKRPTVDITRAAILLSQNTWSGSVVRHADRLIGSDGKNSLWSMPLAGGTRMPWLDRASPLVGRPPNIGRWMFFRDWDDLGLVDLETRQVHRLVRLSGVLRHAFGYIADADSIHFVIPDVAPNSSERNDLFRIVGLRYRGP
jgi:hypothetical protein